MSTTKTWLITGAGRGMGVAFAKAALAAGENVVATARDQQAVTRALGEHDALLAVALDVTDPAQATAAVDATIERFGRLDVLVNNAGSFYAGFFEELTPEQVDAQLQTNLIGPMIVARAALPAMRRQRSGHVVNISSLGGLIGMEFCSAYSAAKFGLEGWSEALATEVEAFGIHVTVVEPGFFRTELLQPESTTYAEPAIDDYAQRTEQTITAWRGMDGQQAGDPAKLAQGLLTIAAQDEPPLRWVAGADAVGAVEQKLDTVRAQLDAFRDLSTSLDLDDDAAA